MEILKKKKTEPSFKVENKYNIDFYCTQADLRYESQILAET